MTATVHPGGPIRGATRNVFPAGEPHTHTFASSAFQSQGRLVAETNVRRTADNLGLTKDTVTKYLRRLREYGFVLQEETRDDGSGRYETPRSELWSRDGESNPGPIHYEDSTASGPAQVAKSGSDQHGHRRRTRRSDAADSLRDTPVTAAAKCRSETMTTKVDTVAAGVVA